MGLRGTVLRSPGQPRDDEVISVPKPRAPKLETVTSRLRLSARGKPYYVLVSPNISLGYRRNATGAGTWSVRCTEAGADWIKKIGISDDLERADDRHIFSYWQAVELARKIARREPGDP